MAWTENDLAKLRSKGLIINDQRHQDDDIIPKKPKIKIVKISIEKNYIRLILEKFKSENKIDDYITEFRFSDKRRFLFDWAIGSLKIAIEYEGVISEKSRHTTITGYSKDCVKYNLAQKTGWRILRYTALNYLDLETDLIDMISEITTINPQTK